MKYSVIALLLAGTGAIQVEDDYKLRAVLGALAGDAGSHTYGGACGCNTCPCPSEAATPSHVSSKAAEKAAAKGAAKAVEKALSKMSDKMSKKEAAKEAKEAVEEVKEEASKADVSCF